jgi:hypothetical protein
MHYIAPCEGCLLGEEDISLFDLGHDIGVSPDFMVLNALAVDHLIDLDEVGRRALEGDDCVARRDVALKPLELFSKLHSLSLCFTGLGGCAMAHTLNRSGQRERADRLPAPSCIRESGSAVMRS